MAQASGIAGSRSQYKHLDVKIVKIAQSTPNYDPVL